MAGFIKKWKTFWKTPLGQALEIPIYVIMFLLVLIYFTGNGVFIYEAF